MGCDIHCYVEHKRKDSTHWNAFGGRINPGRWYYLFGKLAGVRDYGPPIIAPRGVPDDLAYAANGDWRLYITPDGNGDGCCSLESAKEWERYGSKIEYRDGKAIWVTNPDWHTSGWLTADELEQVIKAVEQHGGLVEYRAVLAAMRTLEKDDQDVRLVFWFDN